MSHNWKLEIDCSQIDLVFLSHILITMVSFQKKKKNGETNIFQFVEKSELTLDFAQVAGREEQWPQVYSRPASYQGPAMR